MKRVLFILSLIMLATSCGPSRHSIPVEMRHPSVSGLELSGKTVSVIYSNIGNPELDGINANMSSAFAKALEKEYATGEGSVKVYEVDGRAGVYTEKDSLFNLLMRTGADMVFLFDAPDMGKDAVVSGPLVMKLYCYDGMDQNEKVHAFSGSTVITSADKLGMALEASETGKTVAESFFPQWKLEQYSIAYYDSSRWYDALMKAEQYDWKGAMDIWIALLDTNDMMKRASAEYNIAVACYMLGDVDLAGQWLDKSVRDNEMPTLTDALRKRIMLSLQGRR